MQKKQQIRVHIFIFLCICFLGLFSARCSKDKDRISAGESKVTILTGGDEWIFSPTWDSEHRFLIFLPLAVKNEQGELEGRLAESWEHTPDYRTWTIHLRKDIKWHDGVPFTANDIRFTMDLFAHPAVLLASPGSYTLTIIDDHTYSITFHKSSYNSMNPISTWTLYYPKHILENLDPEEFWEWDYWIQPIGNGPYRYVRHVPKTMIELEANPDYYKGKPKVEKIVLKFGGSTPMTELLSGNVDIADVSPMDIAKLTGNPNFKIYHKIYPQIVMVIFWNHKYPLFNVLEVRRALTLAIDRRELYQLLNFPNELPIYDMIFAAELFWRNELPEPLPYDPELAKKLLDEVGWRDSDSDGVREHGGQKFHFTALTIEWGGLMEMQKAAVYVQEKLRRIGVKMEIQAMAEGLPQRFSSGDFLASFTAFTANSQFLAKTLSSAIKTLGSSSYLNW